MPLDFNVAPYFDDYDPKKNFYKILFQPSRPTQTRELNQLQSILQEQISRFGNHMFKNGTMVLPGHVYYDNKVISVKLNAVANSVSANSVVSELQDKVVVGQSTGVRAKVIHYETAEDSGAEPVLYVKFVSGGNDGETVFENSETLIEEDDSSLVVSTINTNAVSNAAICSIDEGVYFVNGVFVQVNAQKVSLDSSSSKPTTRVGLIVTESIVTVDDDDSLYDNALSYPNYGAPGADRYKIELVLSTRSFDEDDQETDGIEKFIDVLHVKNGKIVYKVNNTEYAELEKIFARRTYDESGDYEVSPFSIELRDFRSNDRGLWAPGIAYVTGDVVETSLGEHWEAVRSGVSGNNEPTVIDDVYTFEDNSIKWIYSVDPFFNSGTDDTTSASVETERAKANQMTYRVSDGKAYIKGFEVNKQDSTDLVVDKAVEYENSTSEIIDGTCGVFTEVFGMEGVPDINKYQKVNLYMLSLDEIENFSSLRRTATATSVLSSGSIIEVSISDYGFGYDRGNVPTIEIGYKWETNETVSIGFRRYFGEHHYAATTNGTTGATPPTHGTGIVSDGGVSWEYLGEQPVLKAYVNQTSEIYNIKIVNAGSGFASVPTLTISAPPIEPVSIGTCRVRSVEWTPSSGAIGSNDATYNLEIFNTNLFSGYSWEIHVRSMIGVEELDDDLSKFKANVVQYKVPVTGTVSITSTQDELMGTGTQFTSDLVNGQLISVENADGAAENRVRWSTLTDNFAEVVNDWSVTKQNAQIFAYYSNIDGERAGTFVPLPFMFIRAIRSPGDQTYNINYAVRRLYKTQLSAGVVEITCSPGEQFELTNTLGNYIVSYWNGTSLVILQPSEVTLTLNANRTRLTVTTALTNQNVEILSTIRKTTFRAKEKVKKLRTKTLDIVSKESIDSQEIILDEADVYRVISIKQSGGDDTLGAGSYPAFVSASSTDITDHYMLDDGQRLSAYELGSIVRKVGKSAPTNSIRVIYEYFEHSAGDFFSVDSYVDVPYDRISPVARDMLDFRPRRASNNEDFSSTGGSITEPIVKNSFIEIDYSYYLPRRDVIVLRSDKAFDVVSGTSSYQLKEPTIPTDAVAIADVFVAPGPIPSDSSIHTVNKRDLRRYTMKDISRLERRVESLEYYTQLSLLETETFKQEVVDQNGLERFKSGILTDDFSSIDVSDTSNPDFLVSFDEEQKELRSFAINTSVDLKSFDILDTQRFSKNYRATGDMFSLNYTEGTAVSQTQASGTISVNPFNVITWVGSINLYPDRDNWIETKWNPSQTIDNRQQGSPGVNTVWNSISAVWSVSRRSRFNTAGGGNATGASLGTFASGVINNIPINTAPNAGSFVRRGLTDSNFYFNGSYRSGARSGNLGGGVNQASLAGVFAVWDSLQKGRTLFPRAWIDIAVTRRGTRTTLSDNSSTEIIESISSEIIPEMRARPIVFVARNLKPNAKFDVTFDDRNMNSRCSTMTTLIVNNYTSPSSIRKFSDSDIFDLDKNEDSSVDPNIAMVRKTSTKNDFRHPIQQGSNVGSSFDVFWERGSILTQAFTHGLVVDVYDYSPTQKAIVVFNSVGSWAPGEIRLDSGVTVGTVASVIAPASFSTYPKSTGLGRLYGVFYLPYTNAVKFGTQESKVFKITESIPDGQVQATPSIAAAAYTATGTLETKRKTTVLYSTLAEEEIEVTDTFRFQYEPIAQTFTLTDNEPNGAFITSVDIFISEVNASSTQPIIVEIRNTVNGYPGQEILAVAEKMRNEVTLNSVTPTSTNFILRDPITNQPVLLFLEPGVEYSIVVRSEDSSWRCWIATMGEQRRDTAGIGNTITEQPSIGSFFKSQNASTWTAEQYSDLTFRINKAQFVTDQTSDILFVNKPLSRTVLEVNSLFASEGSSIVRVDQTNHGFVNGDKVRISAVDSGPFTTALGKEYLVAENAEDSPITMQLLTVSNTSVNSYTVDVSELKAGITASYTGYFGGEAGLVTFQRQFNTLVPNIRFERYNNTDVSVSIQPLYSDYTPLDEFIVINRENVHFVDPMIIASTDNEVGQLGNEKSFRLRVTMNSQDANLSPILNYKDSSVVLVRNIINDPDPDVMNIEPFDFVEIANATTMTFNYDELDPENSYFETEDTTVWGDFEQISEGNIIKVTGGTTSNVGKEFVVLSKNRNDTRYRVYVDSSNIEFNDEVGVTATMSLGLRYVDESAPSGTSCLSKYIHKAMSLSVPATALTVTLDLNLPSNTFIELYYRTTLSNKNEDINSVNWKRLSSTRELRTVSNFSDFVEYQFTKTNIESFDACQIKVAFKSTNSAVTPRAKRLRVMALA